MEITQQPVNRRKHLNKGQGLAEYSLIIALVAVVCVTIIIVLGKGTKTAFQKVNCSIPGSTDPQCGCLNEKLTVTGACVGNNLGVTVTSSCTGASLTVNGNTATTPGNFTWNPAPVCTGGATSFTVQSSLPSPYNTSKSYSVSKP